MLNVVTGGPTAGAAVAYHMDIDKVSPLGYLLLFGENVYVILRIQEMEQSILYMNKLKSFAVYDGR